MTIQYLRDREKKSPADVLNMAGIRLLGCAVLTAAMLLSLPATAQDSASTADVPPPATLEQAATRKVIRTPEKHFVTFALENDSIGSGHDEDYTNGARISYFDANAGVPDIIHAIAGHIPTFDINQTTSVFYTLGQNLYTPSDITIREDVPGDRPWAAWLYISAGLVTVTNNHIDEVELTAGVIGPAALGEPIQRVVHKALNANTPRGWDNQLHNEPGLMASWTRRWPDALGADLGPLHASFEPSAGLTLGNVYTYANAGGTIAMGPKGQIQDSPPRVRPSVPGTGYFATPDDEFSWYVFSGIEARAVARNVFLDGNTFRDSPSVDKKPLVGDASAGIALTWDDIRVSYSLTYRTKEFDGQDDESLFGGVTIGYRY